MSKANVIRRPFEEILDSSFGRYAKYIIQDRALPDIRDGLKPVQRRILYAMYDLGITYDKPYKKSARSVGEVIGKYHPHGDSSIYEAMVRMSQEWKNNITLLDMHGNKGSIDGDSAAAMRYTECRLSKFSEYMLESIKKNTVDFIPNFDDSESEPTVLPSLIPNLLINGATGIAAGYATNIPPFNSTEVFDAIIHRIDNPNCHLDTLIRLMPGPDFPTAGIINGVSGIHEAYATGRGKFIIKGECEENQLSKKVQQLIIKSIPYETSKANIIRAIDDLVFNGKLNGVLEVRDESDKNGVCIAVDIESDKSIENIKNFIYKNTPLQVSYAINFIAIHNRKPIQMSLPMALDAYIQHALNILVKSLKFDLDKAIKRAEILKGLIKALSILDDVIALIKRSTSRDDAKQNLIQKLSFTENQADAIVNLRLYRLTTTDVASIKKESDELIALINEIQMILASEDLQRNTLKKILRAYKSEFNSPRKTTIIGEVEKIMINEADLQENKEVVVMVTRDGYLKTTTNRSIEASTYGEFALKNGDILLDMFTANTLDQIVVITNNGQYISIPCHKIKNAKYKDSAEHINNIIPLDAQEKIIFAFAAKNISSVKEMLLLCTTNGQIKQIQVNDLTFSKSAKTSTIFSLKDGDQVVACQLLLDQAIGEVLCLTKQGLGLRFNIEEVPVVGRGAGGVRAQKLLPNDKIIACLYTPTPNKHQVLISANRGFKRIRFNSIALTKRSNIGKLIMLQVKNEPFIINNAFLVNVKDTVNVLLVSYDVKTVKAVDIGLTDLETRFIDLKTGPIIISYRDHWLSGPLVTDETTVNDDLPPPTNPIQGSLF